MRDEKSGVKLPACSQIHDLPAVAAVHAACLENKILPVHIRKRKLLGFFIHRHNHNDRIRPRDLPCGLECIRPSGDLEYSIRAASVRQLFYDLLRIIPAGYQSNIGKALFFRQIQPVFIRIYGNDPGWRIEARAHHRTQAGRTRSDHGDRIRRIEFTDLRRPVTGGQDISVKERLFIRHVVRYHGESVICERDPGILCLSAVDPASKRPAAVRIRTVIYESPFAEKTFSAERLNIY